MGGRLRLRRMIGDGASYSGESGEGGDVEVGLCEISVRRSAMDLISSGDDSGESWCRCCVGGALNIGAGLVRTTRGLTTEI
jgi:hypothetical protein